MREDVAEKVINRAIVLKILVAKYLSEFEEIKEKFNVACDLLSETGGVIRLSNADLIHQRTPAKWMYSKLIQKLEQKLKLLKEQFASKHASIGGGVFYWAIRLKCKS